MFTEACGGTLKSMTTRRLEAPHLGTVCNGQQIKGWGKGLLRNGPAMA